MKKKLLYISTAFSFFIICPRMASILHVICTNSNLPLYRIALLGSLIALPLILLMVWMFSKFKLTGALIYCVGTDLVAAFLLSDIGYKAGLETAIIALFVFVSVKIAPKISNLVFKTK
ncbi:MAG: hypothetical protein U9R54_06505 [Bacteroidota bacterium]|nr:hypothetical protein [Bacteroidota bacterium]